MSKPTNKSNDPDANVKSSAKSKSKATEHDFDEVSKGVSDAISQMSDGIVQGIKVAESVIRQNPIEAMVATLSAGVLVGLLLGRRK